MVTAFEAVTLPPVITNVAERSPSAMSTLAGTVAILVSSLASMTVTPPIPAGAVRETVPVVVPPGRRGIEPRLDLAYSTGNGNGFFGLGWTLSLPGISRKTSRGVPVYDDDTDTFILSGAEDLVPVYRQDPDGTWIATHPGYYRDPDGYWVRDAAGQLLIHEGLLVLIA